MFTRKCALGPGHELDPDRDFRFVFDVAGEGGGCSPHKCIPSRDPMHVFISEGRRHLLRNRNSH